MATSQVIDTLQFGQVQTVSKENGSNSCAEKSDEFNNIFENINKAYSAEKKETQNATAKNNNDNNNDKMNNVKNGEDKTNQEINESAKKELPKNKEESNVQSKTVNETAQDENNQETENIESLDKKNQPLETDTNVQSTLTENTQPIGIVGQETITGNIQTNENSKIQEPAPKKDELVENIAEQTESKPVEADLNADLKVAIKTPSIQKSESTNDSELIVQEDVTPTTTSKTDSETEVTDTSIPTAPIKIAEETLDLLTQNAIEGFVASVDTNVSTPQPAVKQDSTVTNSEAPIISNEQIAINNVSNIANQPKTPVSTAPQAPIQTLGANIPSMGIQTEETPSPLVKVATDAIASNVSVDNKNSDPTQNISPKTSLTQEVLDSMDAKVTKVETSNFANSNSNQNSNSNTNSNLKPLLTQQNTQEQAIKLELENNDSKISIQNNIQNTPANTQITNPTTPNTSATVQPDLTGAVSVNSINQTNTTTMQAQNSATAGKELNQSDIMSQIDKQLNLKTPQNGESKVTIILRPENLGKIELELVSTKEGLTAKMTTDNAQVKELLDKSLDNLRDTLGSQGVNVNNVTVKINESQKQDAMFSFDKQPGQENQQQNQQNAKQTNEGQFGFDDKLSDSTDDPISEMEIETETEKTVPISNKVDYKV